MGQLLLGAIGYGTDELAAILDYGGPDASLKLAHQLVATEFNLLSGSDPAIEPTADYAHALLASDPPGSDPKGAAKSGMLAVKDLLDAYDNDDCGPE